MEAGIVQDDEVISQSLPESGNKHPHEEHRIDSTTEKSGKKGEREADSPCFEELKVRDSIHVATEGPPDPRDVKGCSDQLQELLGPEHITDLPAAIHEAFTVIRTNNDSKKGKAG